jgi:hypothetical protein
MPMLEYDNANVMTNKNMLTALTHYTSVTPNWEIN